MTTHPPDEALHFRGKTLTPESPRPLHVAEPANIPVLQNQMDPVFNDTSTYEKSESGHATSQHTYHDGRMSYMPYAISADNARVETGGENPDFAQGQEPGSLHGVSRQDNGSLNGNNANFSDASKADPLSNQDAPAVAGTSAVQGAGNNSNTALTASPSDPYHHHHSDATHMPNPLPNDPPQTASEIPSSAHTQPQDASGASEVDTAVTSSATPPAPQDQLLESREQEDNPSNNSGEGGVDFDNLLNNLSRPPPTASFPTASVTTLSAEDSHIPPTPSDRSHRTPSGLPPRPPPQEKPSINPNYSPTNDIRSYHNIPQSSSNAAAQYTNQQSNFHGGQGLPPLAAAGAPGTSSGTSSLPPPPVASFQQSQSPAADSQEVSDQIIQRNGRIDRQLGRHSKSDEDTPWGPEVQKKYDEFLHDERIYVTEGLWDRFPPGSRLFVGNLPTERVTKRDLFHIFHKYGKLAQISIKQAYGFIQFLAANSCHRALEAEQGAVVRGRKIHLEISKPQRNTRQGPPPADAPRGSQLRRSRSPDYGRGGPSGRSLRPLGDRYDRSDSGRLPFSDFRDEHPLRRRDDYRPPRSPSPRGFRGRDEYRARDRDRTPPERYDRRERRRSRSPYIRDRRYRSPSPRPRSTYDSDSDLPVPRRAARDVPDIQILVLEDVDRNFVFHVENSFRNRGLRVDVLTLGPRIPLSAAVQRQVNEGVRAIVKLSRSNQFSGKVSLQLIDRTGGPGNIRFNDYPDLDIGIAIEVVFHAQSLQRSGAPAFPVNPTFGVPQIPTVPVSQPALSTLPALSTPPNVANLITSLDAPTLQSLLATLQQQQQQQPVPTAQQPFPQANIHPGADLASLLSSATRQPQPMQTIPQQPTLPSQSLPVQQPNAPVIPDPNLMSLLAKGLGGQQPQGRAPVGPNVQNIVNQLAKWKQ